MANEGAGRPGRPPGQQGQALLDTARDAFLEHGFTETTMRLIASRAGVSKSSLYREHPSKDALYVAVVSDWTARGRNAMQPHLDTLVSAPDLRRGLVEFCTVLRAAVLSPTVARMRTLVAAQSDRFPDVARGYWESSWEANIAALARALATLVDAGRMVVDDPQVCAEQLVWLTVGGPVTEQTLCGTREGDHPSQDREDDRVEEAVMTFASRFVV
ncbi:TetR/AcrR family transcriptional regulator [Salsipaludibacter albus]|uniref:TetR/AcrR family transcriptional regulator n=1 Tax=Salsipaludibacter albus TaxID=2849650 RepID=UPI001EE4284D|nr:TetR/AcrR family transcriptional regulator [Salsipaludibacter albus]MBY5161437.1 TetR/AcrR family transcriptional regulator [Salsipaludibacter albus]